MNKDKIYVCTIHKVGYKKDEGNVWFHVGCYINIKTNECNNPNYHIRKDKGNIDKTFDSYDEAEKFYNTLLS